MGYSVSWLSVINACVRFDFAVRGVLRNGTLTCLLGSLYLPLHLTCSPSLPAHHYITLVFWLERLMLLNTPNPTTIKTPSVRDWGSPAPLGGWLGRDPLRFRTFCLHAEQKNLNEPCVSAPPLCRLPYTCEQLAPPPHKDSRPIGYSASVFTWRPGPLTQPTWFVGQAELVFHCSQRNKNGQQEEAQQSFSSFSSVLRPQ